MQFHMEIELKQKRQEALTKAVIMTAKMNVAEAERNLQRAKETLALIEVSAARYLRQRQRIT
jgi:hypothetical protein